MLIGNCLIARDKNELSFLLSERLKYKNTKVKVIVLDDGEVHQDGYIGGSILLPPPSALYKLVDDPATGKFEFAQMYQMYLMSHDVSEYIATMLVALLRGIDLIFFFNKSDPSMFMDILTSVLTNNYGILTYVGIENIMQNSIYPPMINYVYNLIRIYGYDIPVDNTVNEQGLFQFKRRE